MKTIVTINGAFRPQRVTGQQRYAREIADRLTARSGFVEIAPEGRWSGSSLKEWAWSLARLPRLSAGTTLLSLTARAPLTGVGVLTVHDLFVFTNPEWYSRKYIATHAPALRAQLRSARAIVAVSEPVAAQLREHTSREVVVAPNAPSTVFHAGPDSNDAVLNRFGLTAGAFLLTVGSLEPRKNLVTLARAYASLPASVRTAHPLVIVGGESSIYRDADITWPEGMTATGYLSDEELAILYRSARAVVFPSLAEGFGLPLVEAATAGAGGLVISDIPVFRWICGDGALYVDPASTADIARGLSAAIESGVPPISIPADRFTWDASADTVAELCLSVAQDGRG